MRMTRKVTFAIGISILVVVAICTIVLYGAHHNKQDNSSNQAILDKGDYLKVVIPTTPKSPPLHEARRTVFDIHALAIGDWGTSIKAPRHNSSCCNRHRIYDNTTQEYKKDYWAQRNLAYLLAKSAGALHPKVIIGHGDNFYWNGLGSEDVLFRFQETFEKIYDQPELANIPWVNVIGNHDIGGAVFICGDQDFQFTECESVEDMETHLNLKFELQKSYKSPNGDRWKLDHYFVHHLAVGNTTVDIYNVDSNWADNHGAHQVCCQCFGYAHGNRSVQCDNVQKGEIYCAGGDNDMYDRCISIIKSWWDDSMSQLERDLSESTADWRFINTHYSPLYHMAPFKAKQWQEILVKHKVQVYFNGHTHGEDHDYGLWGTHFFENGAGGGIQSEAANTKSTLREVNHIWVGRRNPYGYFELSFSKLWMKARFVTFGKDWVYDLDPEAVKHGSADTSQHCWYIPVSGGLGGTC